jgi:hypothetical protein
MSAKSHIRARNLVPAPTAVLTVDPANAHVGARRGVADGAITMFDIVYESGESNGQTKFKRADADSAASIKPPLYVALSGASTGNAVDVSPGPCTVPMTTTGASQGDPVYASNTAGGKSLTAGTISQIIGYVRKHNSASGDFTFASSLSSTSAAGGALSFPDGTAAAPGLPKASDPDTGLYGLAANSMGLAFGGVAGAGLATALPTLAAATDTAGATLYLKSPDAGGTATAARVGGGLYLAGGNGSAGSSTIAGGAGTGHTFVAGAGGAKSGTGAAAGGAGGTEIRTSGAGGATASTSTGAGGAGGLILDTTGAGGAATGAGSTGNGGAGGAWGRITGAGGSSIGGTGGVGGSYTDTAGVGGDSSTGAGGAGGGFTFTAAAGGAATAGTGNGGAGGGFDFVPGAGGTSAGGTAGAKGQFKINGVALLIDVTGEYVAASVDKRIFTANRAYRIVAIRGTPDVAGTDGGGVTAEVRKVPSGTAITAGTVVHTGTYNLKGTVDTVQSLTLSSTDANLLLAAGDSLAIDFTGTLTSATGVISVGLLPV